MNILCFGISHKTADLSIRERYALTTSKKKELILELIEFSIAKEAVVLSTCNRTEIYAISYNVENFIDFVSKKLKIIDEDIRYFYLFKDEQTIRHLFRVSCGLESQILGENEILHQVKEAYFFAKECNATGYYLNTIFQKAVRVAKKVKTQTNISKGNISFGSITLSLIEKFLNNLENKIVAIIGTGNVAELVSRYLFDKKMEILFVSNKHYDKAVQLAKKFNGYAIRLENNLENIIIKSDVVITATSSPHVIIKKDFLEKLFQKNIIKKEILFIDLSVPRNIEPEVDEIDNVLLYDLDKIKHIIDNNYNNRILEKEKAEAIIEIEVENLYNKLSSGLLYKNFSTKLCTLPT